MNHRLRGVISRDGNHAPLQVCNDPGSKTLSTTRIYASQAFTTSSIVAVDCAAAILYVSLSDDALTVHVWLPTGVEYVVPLLRLSADMAASNVMWYSSI